MEKDKFSNQVRWYNFILCILVVLVHTNNTGIFTGQAPAVNAAENFLTDKVARTAPAGFFLCSGYLFYRNFSIGRLADKWKRRFFSTVIPFAAWNLLYYFARLAALKLPGAGGYFSQEAVWSLSELFRAIVFCKYNPIFWFLQFLIVYIYICPFIYLLIRGRYTGLAAIFGVFLLACSGCLNVWGSMPASVVNWLFLYMTGGYLGLHEKSRAEVSAGLPVLAFTVLGSAASHLFFAVRPGLAGQLLYFLFDAMLLWNVLSYIKLPEARWWMKDTFYIYAAHFMIVRAGNKLAYLCFGNAVGTGLWMFLLLPGLAVIFCAYSGCFLKRYTPFFWKIISGNRNI